MKQSLVYVALVVKDYDAAIEFFCHKLHFVLTEDTYIEEQKKRWVTIAPPGSTETKILLARPSNDKQKKYIGNQTGGRVTFFLHTDNFWRDYNEMRNKGIQFIREPKDAGYGIVAVWEDLYGNWWDLIQIKMQK